MTTGATTNSSTTASSTTGGIDPLAGADRQPKTGPAEGRAFGQLVKVELGGHEGFDRVLFTFRGDTVPGFRVAYREPPIIEDGSGRQVSVDGAAFLSVRMEPASAFDMEGVCRATGARTAWRARMREPAKCVRP